MAWRGSRWKTELSFRCGPQEVLDRALALSREGDDLIQNSHYAEDSIQPKCSELRNVSDDVSSNLRAKKDHLLKAKELHHRLERVRRRHVYKHLHLNCLFLLFVDLKRPPLLLSSSGI